MCEGEEIIREIQTIYFKYLPPPTSYRFLVLFCLFLIISGKISQLKKNSASLDTKAIKKTT